ncbi:MAG: DUF2520 domain-containing protein [Gammaproteobacteria bacterium]|nr:MAG: DUF2520 domain-containing protein [Gammaproteobacteria bacterium]UTW43703.1 DUF2520 domain-containing protein [bacterium SCSIO 12844]
MDCLSKSNTQYLVIGNGLMAKHFIHYLNILKLSYKHWYRSYSIENLILLLKESTHILFLIKDDAIENFIKTNCLKYKQKDQLYLHFSGSLSSEYAYTTHPLQTFSKSLYTPECYLDIPFAIESEGPKFSQLLPGIPNRFFKIKRKDKAYYHALGAIANNYTTLLWQKYFNTLKSHFNIDPIMAIPLLEQTLINLKNDYQNALTGPIARNDINTINFHIDALNINDDNFLQIYKAFVETHLNQLSQDKQENERT